MSLSVKEQLAGITEEFDKKITDVNTITLYGKLEELSKTLQRDDVEVTYDDLSVLNEQGRHLAVSGFVYFILHSIQGH